MIKIICLGKIKENYLKEAIDDYYHRVNKYHKVEIIELKDTDNLNQEEKEILEKIDNKSYTVLLDIKGKNITSVELANIIENRFISYPTITFIIGSSLGVSDNIKKIVNEKISFGSITMPHGLFRLVLLEQLYRSFKINNNESYHK